MRRGQAISTVVSISIVVIVLIIIGIIFITSSSEGFGQLGGIFAEVFQAEEIAREEAIEVSSEAYESYFQAIDASCKAGCFCTPNPWGNILSEGYRFTLQNNIAEKAAATVLLDDQEGIHR